LINNYIEHLKMATRTIAYILNLSIFLNLAIAQVTKAQVIPDQSLPDNSVVNSEDNTISISGGTTRGNNLFHSFEQFSVTNDITASFQNLETIQNIFSRVTGDSISNIEGSLETQGTANLFLMNPNGIIFGENASLNLGGSFLTTTAETIRFADQTEFGSNVTDTPPLLTITAPVGLDLGSNPGEIINRSSFAADIGRGVPEVIGLQVQPQNIITLVGGEISFEGGALFVDGGRIELGAVAANNIVSLMPDELGWKLNYHNVAEFEDINFNLGRLIGLGDTGGEIILQGQDLTFSGGSLVANQANVGANKNIEIRGRNITLEEGSRVASFTFSSEAGNLIIQGSESVNIRGVSRQFSSSSGFLNQVIGAATGEGKFLSIETKNLIIGDGGQFITTTFGSGRGVDLLVDASESITIEGTVTLRGNASSGLFAGVESGAAGDGGAIRIATKDLVVRDGGQISNSTRGQGNGGEVNIIASDSILLEGRDLNPDNFSGIFSQVILTNPGNSGNAGNITIETKNLDILEGAIISTIARDTGNGGTIKIDASDSIVLNGVSPLGTGSSSIRVSATPETTGDAGSIEIYTKELTVEQDAVITAENEGIGEAGSLVIEAQEITLDNGSFTAETRSGDQGNITLENANTLLLLNNSEITTNAQEEATGGDITITADAIALLDNSNITANAVEGRGGDIQINSQGIFREPNTAITATSELGIDGTITFNTPDFDPTSGIFQLPDIPLDAESVLAQNLCKFEDEKIAKGSSFLITGKGGITPTSADPVDNLDRVVDWSNRDDIQVSKDGSVGIRTRPQSETAQNNYPVIQQSQGWVQTADGSLWLVAEAPEKILQNSGIVHPDCRTSQ